MEHPLIQQWLEWAREYINQAPEHLLIETSLIVIIAYILFVKRSYDPKKRGYGARGVAGLTEKEKQEIIDDWEPEPLVSGAKGMAPAVSPIDYVVESYDNQDKRNFTVKLTGDAKSKLAYTSRDFLGLGSSAEVRADATKALEHFTLGSCGPRGFYGTTSAHLALETELATFMGVPESITYSDELATVTSVIPAFSKRGDILLLDESASAAIQLGARLSRSRTMQFKHNDLADLERQLKTVAQSDKTAPKGLALKQRRFIIVEGVYANVGDVCPIKGVLELAQKYKWRVILDETYSFGVLGKTGRGVLEAAGLQTLDVDLLVGSLATTLGAVGGFCVGPRDLVDHQRLSGAGYCFSASAPPFLCATATSALQRMQKRPELLADLQKKCSRVHTALMKQLKGLATVTSEASVPVKHILLDEAIMQAAGAGAAHEVASSTGASSSQAAAIAAANARAAQDAVLKQIVQAAADLGVLVTRSHHRSADLPNARATLKFYVTAAHKEDELDRAVACIAEAVSKVKNTASKQK